MDKYLFLQFIKQLKNTHDLSDLIARNLLDFLHNIHANRGVRYIKHQAGCHGSAHGAQKIREGSCKRAAGC